VHRILLKLVRLVAVPAAIVAAIVAVMITSASFLWPRLGAGDPDRIWAEAETALRTGNIDRAAAGLRKLGALRAPTPLDWMLRAQVATALGHDDLALESLRQVGREHAMATQAALLAGRIERKQHRLRQAEASFRMVIERQPGLIEAHKELIYIYGIQLRKQDVDAEFKALSRLTQLTHHDLFTWGLTHFTDWDPGISVELEAAIKTDPGDRHSRLALATLLFDQPDAEAHVLAILEPLPCDDPKAAALRIELSLAHGRVEEANAMLDKAPRDNPQLARLRGRAALLRRDHASAIRHFKEALSEAPFDRSSISELGKALILAGDGPSAERYRARARRLDDVYNLINRVSRPNRENQPPDLTRLGKACEAAGLREEATGWYSLAIAREPLDAVAQQALAAMRNTMTP
jgi:tetratricopeptide (TPR) repeat protein